MFGFLYEMLGGEHEELARRRRPDPSIAFDARAGAFVVEEPSAEASAWLGRGELPGRQAFEPQTAAAGELSLVEEMQQLAADRAKAGDGAA